MWLLEDRLESCLGAALRVPLAVAIAEKPLSQAGLTSAEHRLQPRPGAALWPWLTGRAALKRLLHRLGRSDDTATLAFPHPELSVTYAGALAIAVAVLGDARGPGHAIRGVGVDVEAARPVDMAAGRFFLTDAERAWVEGQPEVERSGHLLRLWTVKEALFKATLENVPAILADFALRDPAAHAGHGILTRGVGHPMRYASSSSAQGVMTVAVNAE